MSKEADVSITVKLCSSCADVHLVVDTPDGNFDFGLDDKHWD